MNIFKFKRVNSEPLKPMGVKTTVERPVQPVNRLTNEQMQKMKLDSESKKMNKIEVDPYFIQEISDRLYGPQSSDYIEALKELHKKFKPRAGRTGHDIFKDGK